MSLPSGYKRLEYIQSSGTQYINTGFNPNNNTRVVMDLLYTGSEGISNEFGSWNSSNNASFICLTTGQNNLYPFYGNASKTVSVNRTARHTVDMDKNVVKMNGTTMITFDQMSFQCIYPMFLCCFNNAGVTENMTSMRIYSCQIYDNGTLVRDFIPCQTTSGDIGLWDDVNSVFYGNAGTGTFTAGPVIAIAADKSEITKLEYIQSSGTQFIDTGFKPNQDTGFEADFEVIAYDASALCVFGSRNSADVRYELFARNDDKYQVYYNTSFYYQLPTIINRHSLTMQKNVINLDGISYNASYSTFQINYSFGLFTINNAGTWDSRIPFMRLYSAKLYDNGTLVRNFIPCQTTSGEIGLWDDVNSVFYGNAGTGTFESGPEVGVATPENFRLSSSTETTATLAWSAVDGATGYNLYKNGALITTLTDTSYTDTVQVFSSTVYAVTAYNDDGESEATTLTYYAAPENPILYLVTDRTSADVTAGNEKGTYRASDLNRVGAAMNFVADRLRAVGYDPHISPKTDWKDDDWVAPADEAAYLGDLAELRKQFALLYSTPEVPPRILATGINTNDGLTHTWANDIEKILEDIDLLLTNAQMAWFYSGELFSGEV